MPRLALDNGHSGKHHRTWVNQLIAAEFARRIRAAQRRLDRRSREKIETVVT